MQKNFSLRLKQMICFELFKTEQEYTNQKIEIQKDYAMRNFSKYIQENIIEFKDMGFDLSVEWVE